MKRRIFWITAAVMLTGSMAADAENQTKVKGQKAEAAAQGELVWPPPPDTPRIRYVAMIRGANDVLGKDRRKTSFVERISGKPTLQEQTMLGKPYGVAVDKNGRIYVADPEQRAVVVIDRTQRTVSLRKGTGQYPLFVPIGVAVDESGRLFVSDSFAAQVIVYGPSGPPVAAFGKGTLQRPGGLALNTKSNRLYVADAKRNQVLIYDATTFQQIKAVGGPSKTEEFEPGTFSAPTNLALDSKGRLFVTDTFNCRIQVFDAEGKFLYLFGSQGNRPGAFVRPKGIGIDSQDHVYVADAGFGNFQVFSPEGKPLLFVGSGGDGPGQFVLPAGLAVDREDRIYVTEQRPVGSRLQVFQFLSQPPAPPAAGKSKQ